MAYDRQNVFARILRDELPSDRVYEDDEFIAFRDIDPQAPVHIVLIPRGEAPTAAADLSAADAEWAGRMFVIAAQIAREQGIADAGFRLVVNSGADGGQEVPHLHVHILGGQRLARFA